MNKVIWLGSALALALAGCSQQPAGVGGVLAVFMSISPTNVASGPQSVNGGGTGTFDADLDGDGDIDGSHFGFGVKIRPDGSAQGHFMCQMAGNADFLGLKLMLVEGRISSASFQTNGSVQFAGSGSVNLANGDVFRSISFAVSVTAGGPGTGTMQLTVFEVFDGVAGDTLLGDGNYSLPVETVATGSISIH
ncbi:MAG: hypothetical protein ACREUU_05475 [Gammaproteobacteria bacterium]